MFRLTGLQKLCLTLGRSLKELAIGVTVRARCKQRALCHGCPTTHAHNLVLPPGGSGLRRKQLRCARKSPTSRYYQLLSGHAAIGSFLHERMTGAQRLGSSEHWRRGRGGGQTRHYLFVECKAWVPQIKRLWRRVGKGCEWESPRAPAVRLLWDAMAVDAVVEFLESTRVGCSTMVRMLGLREVEGLASGYEGEEGGPGPQGLHISFVLSFNSSLFFC